MLIKLLSNGLSGANVELRRSNNSFYIRKKANTSSQSRLLMRQAELMQCWDSELISIPQIIQTGKDDCGNFFIDMYYIEGDSFCHYIAHPNILNSQYQWSFAEMLLVHMRKNLSFKCGKSNGISLYSPLVEKLDSLSKNLLRHHGQNIIIENILITLGDYILSKRSLIDELSLAPKVNTVHGDLTLSNIIVTCDQLFFIDPIDHYLGKCVLADYFKLLFDLDFKLSFRVEGHYQLLEGSVLINIARFITTLTELYSQQFRALSSVQNIFLAIEALRVLQYSYHDNDLSSSLLHYVQLKVNDFDI